MKGNTEKMPEERKTVPRWAVRVSMLIYVIASAIAVLGFYSAEVKFLVWVGLAVFLVGFYLRLKFCSCPYCGSTMASKMAKLNGKTFICPNCEQEIGQK
ncbi:MAG: hypothetical protein ACOYEL_00180 [Saccharofermentanales bacterium]|jgi:NADH pyrophosphatase NudC (nudix superfamily)